MLKTTVEKAQAATVEPETLLVAAAAAHQAATDQLKAAQTAVVVAGLRQKALALEEKTRLAHVALVNFEKEAAELAAATAKAALENSGANVERCIKAIVEEDAKVWDTIADATDPDDGYLDLCESPKQFPWWFHHEHLKGNFCKVCISGGAKIRSGGAWTKQASNNRDAK